MSMTSHDYNLLANALAKVTDYYNYGTLKYAQIAVDVAEEAVQVIADTLEANNDNFDRVVFLSKAGL